MKHLSLLLIAAFSIVLISNYSCKKNKTVVTEDTTCGCNATDIKYSLLDKAVTLSYFPNKSKWVCFYQAQPGSYLYYFPCNTTQDSLKAILLNANTSQTFNVKISGKVKATCPNEDFGVTSGITIVDYIIIDSLKRY
jgi:hypothetical protein